MTLRRKLLAFSAPVSLALLIVIAKLFSVVVAGDSAQSAYAGRDVDALRHAVAALNVFDVVESDKAPFAAGSLAVLENRLDDAQRHFGESLARVEPAASCPARVNLMLIGETLGDRAATDLDTRVAVDRYRAARTVVEQAPSGCFAGNDDADAGRRLVRDEALTRLSRKIDAATVEAPPPVDPPSSNQVPMAPAPEPPPMGSDESHAPDAPVRLDPGSAPPLDRLQQILRDNASTNPG